MNLSYLGEIDVMRDEDSISKYGRGAILTDGTIIYVSPSDNKLIVHTIEFEDTSCSEPDDCNSLAPVCDDQLGECTIYPTISLVSDETTICSDGELALILSSNALVSAHILLVTSNSTNPSAFEDLEDHINGEIWNGELNIPVDLIEPGVKYTFTF